MQYREHCPNCGGNDSKWQGYNDGVKGNRRRFCNICRRKWTPPPDSDVMKGDLSYANKEVNEMSREDMLDAYRSTQNLFNKTNTFQKELKAKIDTDSPVILQFMSDLQFGNPAMNLDKHIEYTDYIINTPNLYVGLLGDELDTFFPGFYSGRPVSNTVFPPQQQLMYFEKWLEDIQDKLLFATWDNHTDMRLEKAIGFSPAAMLKSKFCPYFNGIGQTFLSVGEIEYHIVSSHFFKGKSKYNPLHGVMSFAREQVQTADIYAQGDQHQASVGHFALGGKDRVYIMTGTLNNGDEYTNRHFTPFAQCEMPAVVLDNTRRHMVPFRTMESAGTYIKGLSGK